MDHLRYDILAPLIVADRLTEARHEALADLAPPAPSHAEKLALFLGGLLIRVGCRLDAAGRKHAVTVPLTLLPSPCRTGRYELEAR